MGGEGKGVIALDTTVAMENGFATRLIGKNLIFFLKKPMLAGSGWQRDFSA
jgi:hypothetical protein